MKLSSRIFLVGLLVLCYSSGSLAARTEPFDSPDTGSIPTIALCELLHNPGNFDGRRVRLRAVYRYGFEWSEFYCLSCADAKRVWVEFDPGYKKRTRRSERRALGGDHFAGRTVDVTATGTFHSSGARYGHMGAFDYSFVIDRVERARVLLNDSPVPSALPQDKLDRFRVCGRSRSDSGSYDAQLAVAPDAAHT